MKNLALLFIVAFVNSCRSHEPQPLLVGHWRWQESYSWGCVSNYKSFPKANEQVTLHFDGSGKYNVVRNDTLLDSGSYHVAFAKDNETGKTLPQATFYPNERSQPNPLYYTYSMAGTQTLYEYSNQKLSLGVTIGTSSSGSIYTRIR